MYDLKTELYYSTFRYKTDKSKNFWNVIFDGLGPEAKLWLNIATYFGKNSLVARDGVWRTPCLMKIPPMFEMPAYDPSFSLSFEEVTDLRALDIKKLINDKGSRVALYYSGGIDSTISLVSLIRNLSAEELSYIDIGMSSESIIENPYFYEKYIANKFNIIDSGVLQYSDIESAGNYAISCDQGDSIFGTEIGTQMYHSYGALLKDLSSESKIKLENLRTKISDPDIHYSNYADMIIAFFRLGRDPDFGRRFYEKIVLNIETATVPVKSLHDFFWWEIFNLKYMECALRGSIYYYSGNDRHRALNDTIINWFNHENYQKWSMVNNNNGQKIKGSSSVNYKWAARQYIYAFDKNDWYFKYKTKLSSLRSIIYRNETIINARAIFGMDTNCNLLHAGDPDVSKLMKGCLEQFG